MKILKYYILGSLLLLGLIVSPVAVHAQTTSSGLSASQIGAIISLLKSFGASDTVVSNVEAALGGSTTPTPVTFCYNWTTDLGVGSSGADVTALGEALFNLGVTDRPYLNNDQFDEALASAVVRYQQENNISPVSGYVGPITRSTLNKEFSCGTTQPTAPTIYYVTPKSGAVGTLVTIHGSGLNRNDLIALSYNGQQVATENVQSGSKDQISFILSPITIGTMGFMGANNVFQLSAYDPTQKGGSASNSVDFAITGDGGTATTTPVTQAQPIVITDVEYSPAAPYVNDMITTAVTVKNESSADFNSPFEVDVQGTTVTVPSLASGAQTTVTVPTAFSFSVPGTETLNTVIIYPIAGDPGSGNTGNMFTNTLTFLPVSTPTTGFPMTLTSSNSSLNVFGFKDSFDGTKNDPASVTLSFTCPQGVQIYDSSLNQGEPCGAGGTVNMTREGDGAYSLPYFQFSNTTGSNQTVVATAQAYGISTTPVATASTYFTVVSTTSVVPVPTPPKPVYGGIDSQNPGAGLSLAPDATLAVQYLPNVKADHAGSWGQFGPSGNNDYVNQAQLKLTSSKTIKSVLFSTNMRGMAGFTSSQNVDGIQLYPAVVFYNGNQLNTAYDQTLGTYGPGSYTFTVYDESTPYDMPYQTFGLTFYFTDGTYVTATTPGTASQTNPPIPVTPVPVSSSPVIVSISPTSAPAGSSVALSGSGFDGNSYVVVGSINSQGIISGQGISPTSFTSNSINFTLPSNMSAGSYPVQVIELVKGAAPTSNFVSLNVTSSNQTLPLSATCTGSPNGNLSINWQASAVGGSGSYTYQWSAYSDANNYGSGSTQSSTFSQMYGTPGTKLASVLVKDGNTSVAMKCSATAVSTVSTQSLISVLSPNGGESWQTGTMQTIKWQDARPIPECAILNTSAASAVSAALYRPVCGSQQTYDIWLIPGVCSGSSCTVNQPAIIAKAVSGTSYQWNVGTVLSNAGVTGNYKMQVCASGSSVCGLSNASFTLTSTGTTQPSAVVTITSPLSGTVLNAGTAYTFTSSSAAPLNNVTLTFKNSLGQIVRNVHADVVAAQSTFNWTIPAYWPSGLYTVSAVSDRQQQTQQE